MLNDHAGSMSKKNNMDNIAHNQGRLVYHYTSLKTFLALLDNIRDDSLVFHASGMHCMNDSTEFIYGLQEFCRILPALEKTMGDIDEDMKLSTFFDNLEQSIQSGWNKSFTDILLEDHITPFVISTSSDGDSVPMWAMYGDDGHGVALGIDVANCYMPVKLPDGMIVHDMTDGFLKKTHAFKIVQHLSLEHPSIQYSKIIYNKYLGKAKGITNEEELTRLKIRTLYHMSLLPACLVKHPAFQFEKEWRIVCEPTSFNNIQYKINSKGNLTPYIKVPIQRSFLRKVVLGPCCEKAFQKSMIKRLLSNHQLSNCKVVTSKVPYRS